MKQHARPPQSRPDAPPSPQLTDDGLCLLCNNERLLLHGATVPAAPCFDYQLECDTLGAMMLLNPQATATGVQRLQPGAFYHPRNRNVFLAIRWLWQRARAVDEPVVIEPIIVGTQLRRMKVWDKGYTDTYLRAVAERCPCAANISYYVDSLLECWQTRRLLELSEQLRAFTNTPDDAWFDRAPGELINAARLALDAIERNEPTTLDKIFQPAK